MIKNNDPNEKKANQVDTPKIKKLKTHIIVELIGYLPNAVVSRTIIRKTTGNVTAMSFAEGEQLGENTAPFDTFIQIVDGKAEIIINNNIHQLELGNGIVIPANQSHCFNANERFKMISTIIKSDC